MKGAHCYCRLIRTGSSSLINRFQGKFAGNKAEHALVLTPTEKRQHNRKQVLLLE